MITEFTQLQFYPESPFSLFSLRLQGTQTEMGEDLARIAKEHHGVDSLASPIPDVALRAKQTLLSRYCPTLVDRAVGVSHFFGGNQKSFDPYTLPLVETPPAFGCSAAFLNEKNDSLLLRNFDFTLRSFPELLGAKTSGGRPMIDPVYLMVIEPEGGFRSIALVSTDLFMGAFDGINDRGFCVALLALSNATRQMADIRFDAFDESTIPRILLESCETVDEAIALFAEIPKQTVFIPCHYIVGDRDGNAAVLEWHETSGVGITRRKPLQPLLCTNHYLSSLRDLALDEGHETESQQRLATLKAHLPQSPTDHAALWNAAKAVSQNVLGDDGSTIGGTLWTSLYQTKLPGLDVRFLTRIHGENVVYSQKHSVRFE